MKKQVPYCVRQGDVLLVSAAYRGGMPPSAKSVKAGRSAVILAHGEVTGHAHAIREAKKIRYFDAAAERYLQVVEKTALTHEEHGAVLLSPENGSLQQAFQVEDFGEEVRRVAD